VRMNSLREKLLCNDIQTDLGVRRKRYDTSAPLFVQVIDPGNERGGKDGGHLELRFACG